MNRVEVLNKRLLTAQSVGIEAITEEKDLLRVTTRSLGRNKTTHTVLVGIASVKCDCPDPTWICKHRLRAIFEVVKLKCKEVSFHPDRLSASIKAETLTEYSVWIFGELWVLGYES